MHIVVRSYWRKERDINLYYCQLQYLCATKKLFQWKTFTKNFILQGILLSSEFLSALNKSHCKFLSCNCLKMSLTMDVSWFIRNICKFDNSTMRTFTIVVTVTDTLPDLEESEVGPTCSCLIVKERTYASRTLSHSSFMAQSCLKYLCNFPMFSTLLFSTILQVRNKIVPWLNMLTLLSL